MGARCLLFLCDVSDVSHRKVSPDPPGKCLTLWGCFFCVLCASDVLLWKISPGPRGKCPTWSWGFVFWVLFVLPMSPSASGKSPQTRLPRPKRQAFAGHYGGPFSVFFVFPLSLSGRSPLWIVVACASSLVFVFIISLRGSLLFVIGRRVSGPALSLLRSIGGVASPSRRNTREICRVLGVFCSLSRVCVCVCECVMEAEGGRDKRGPRPEWTEVLSPRVRGVGGVQSGHPRGRSGRIILI